MVDGIEIGVVISGIFGLIVNQFVVFVYVGMFYVVIGIEVFVFVCDKCMFMVVCVIFFIFNCYYRG